MSLNLENKFKRKRQSCERIEDETRPRIVADDLPAHVNYWLNEANPDCYFKVGPEGGPVERIGAIKVFLAAHSEPFRAMFEQNYKEGQNGEVRITDVEAATFKTLLRCICGGNHITIDKLTMEESAELLKVADKYLVDYVKEEVLAHMGRLLNCKNVLTALSCPACLQDAHVSERVLQTLQYSTREILSDERFSDLSVEALFWVLQQKDFNAEEVDVWLAVLEWGKRKSNSSDGKTIRRYLYPFLNHVRFLTMDLKDFWKYVAPQKVLNLEEVVEISKALSTGVPHEMEHICRAMRPRQFHVVSDKITIVPFTYLTYAEVTCAVTNCCDCKWQEDSKRFHWSGFRWNISVGRRNDLGYETFAVFISCYGFEYVYKCPVTVSVTLINERGNRQHYRTFSGVFTEQTPSIGISDFCSWDKMNDYFVMYNEAKLKFVIGLI